MAGSGFKSLNDPCRNERINLNSFLMINQRCVFKKIRIQSGTLIAGLQMMFQFRLNLTGKISFLKVENVFAKLIAIAVIFFVLVHILKSG